jgi:trans-aconitate 2-methyltransferase
MNNQRNSKDRWNATLYENKHSFVWQYGTDLIDLLSPRTGEKILDLGCGTGQLTDIIAATGAEVVGIDRSPAMIAKAKENYPDIQFLVADGANFSFPEPFDAIFSNAALHWIKPPEAAIACIWQALKADGRFIAEFGGKGNVEQIIAAIDLALKKSGCQLQSELNPWYFASIGEYATLLEQQGFEVTHASLLARPTKLAGGEMGLRNWLEMFASSLLSIVSPSTKVDIMTEIEKQLRSILYRDGSWVADYKRIRVVATKKIT